MKRLKKKTNKLETISNEQIPNLNNTKHNYSQFDKKKIELDTKQPINILNLELQLSGFM